MFGFLKDKLKSVISKFTKRVEQEAPEEKVTIQKEVVVAPPEVKEAPKVEKKVEKKPKIEKPKVEPKVEVKPEVKIETPEEKPARVEPEKPKIEVPLEKPVEAPKIEKPAEKIEAPEEKGFFAKLKEKFVAPKIEEKPSVKEEVKPEVEEKKGFFQKITETITTKKISAEKFDEMFWDLELALLENNVAVEVIEKIKLDLKSQLVDKPIPRGKVEEKIAESLHQSIEDLFKVQGLDLLAHAKQKTPFVICFVGINGSGKTTTIAKMAKYFQNNGLSVVMAAADTFRAAAIDQLQLHADNLGIKLIKHDYGSDPAAVAFDAIKHAEATKKSVVLIDTAGRLHSNVNLMDEMKKIVRVANPDVKIFVGESITGNDCVEQAKQFNETIGIDGIILSKADVDEKGGAAISVSYVTQKPILFLGVGQEYDDLQVFDKERLLASIGL